MTFIVIVFAVAVTVVGVLALGMVSMKALIGFYAIVLLAVLVWIAIMVTDLDMHAVMGTPGGLFH